MVKHPFFDAAWLRAVGVNPFQVDVKDNRPFYEPKLAQSDCFMMFYYVLR